MLAVVRDPIVLAAALGAVRTMQAVVVLWLTSRERQRVLARVLGTGRAGVVVEHRGVHGTQLTVRLTGRAVGAQRGRRS